MKKIFTLILALLSLSGAASDIKLLFGSDYATVLNGATYQTGYTEMKLGAMMRYTQNTDLFIQGGSGTDVVVEVKSDYTVAVCSITGSCTNGTEVTKAGKLGESQSPVAGTSDIYDLRIDLATTDRTGAAPSELLHDITVHVKAYTLGNASDAIECTVVMRNIPQSEIGSVGNVGIEGNYFALNNGATAAYHFLTPTAVEIYDITGKLVWKSTLSGIGHVALPLRKGVYIYRAATLSGKLLLK